MAPVAASTATPRGPSAIASVLLTVFVAVSMTERLLSSKPVM